ncbi:MAG: molecular chaperone TorD family protein [Candidatus Binatia bacterium]
MELTNLQSEPERIAAGRSQLYQLLALAFRFPDEEFYQAVRDGTCAAAIARVSATLPYDVSGAATPDLARADEAYADFESEYIRLFDVGAAGPPCPLYGGVYGGDRMKVMEEATRFYNFFQLRLSPQLRELPDHITTELEFLHYLTFREAEARQHGLDPMPLLRAERDFLTRHLCKWVPHLQARLARHATSSFFPALVRFATAFFEADRAYAATACEQ